MKHLWNCLLHTGKMSYSLCSFTNELYNGVWSARVITVQMFREHSADTILTSVHSAPLNMPMQLSRHSSWARSTLEAENTESEETLQPIRFSMNINHIRKKHLCGNHTHCWTHSCVGQHTVYTHQVCDSKHTAQSRTCACYMTLLLTEKTEAKETSNDLIILLIRFHYYHPINIACFANVLLQIH